MHYEALMTDAQKELFGNSYDKSPETDCWLWNKKARHNFGYGVFSIGRYAEGTQKQVTAHRLSYDIANGPIPEGFLVLHRCDVPGCVNPEHLYLGDHKQNAFDRDSKGRCKRRQPRGELNSMAKLTDAQVLEIRASNEMGTILAARYAVSAGHICGIRKGRCRTYS